MTYDFECLPCGIIEERYVHTFAASEDEICAHCGTKMRRLIANSAKIEIWKHTSIPEIDKDIHFRSMRHAKEVRRAKGLSPDMSNKSYEKLKDYDLEAQKRNEERLMRQPVVFDMARRATG